MAEPTDRGRAVLKQFQGLKAIRDPLDQDYRDCYRFTYPTLGTGFQNTESGILGAQTAKTETAQLLDSTATDSVRLLASSVLSSLTPPNTRWFDATPPIGTYEGYELDQDGKEWLDKAASRVHTMIHASNYDTEAYSLMVHLMVAGMAGIYVELKNNKLHFSTWPLNHLYCQETLNEGYIDTVYRSFNFTAQEAVLEFGLENLPQQLKEAYRSNEHDSKKFQFTVCIRPRIKGGKQSTGTTKKNLPWESLWVHSCGTIVRESGFHEMPVIVPRWLKIPDTDYARSPVFDALPDIKTLNKVKEQMLLNMEMHITGMFKVKDDGVINPNNVKFGARRVIPVGDMDNLQPLRSGGDIDFAVSQIQSLQGSVRKMLLADQLGPTEKAIQTATEVTTRNNQVMQILGPIFAGLQSEFLTHLIARCFGLAIRAGLLPQIPESISQGDGNFEIEYRSPLARAQKKQELVAIDEVTTRVTKLSLELQKPELLDKINFEAIVDKYGDLLGIDPALLNDENEVKKKRLIKQKEQQAAQASQERMAAAQAQASAPVPPESPTANLEMMA